jgi:Tfp pilus assembly protein PilN
MPAINLLPTDLSPKSSIARVSKIIKNASIVGLVLVIVSAVGIIAFLTVTSFQIRNSNTQQDQLKAGIKSLEQTEQRLVLTKDRLKYAEEVLGKETAVGAIEDLSLLFSSLPEEVNIREAQISATKTELSLVARNSSALTQVLASLVATNYYENIKLTSFAFNINSGYIVSVSLSK